MQITGALTALVTPFKNGAVDEEKYRELIEWQIQEGIHGLVTCGTTGEPVTLKPEEYERVIAICIDQVKKRVPVVAGTGSNCTAMTIALTQYAKKAGADATLVVTPYYNKPTQEGLVAHYKALGKEVSIPIIVYDVPGRTAMSIAPAIMARIYKEVPEVIGIKDATANLVHVSDILELCDDKFCLLSGDDFTILPIMAIGGKGVISVVSNAMPKAVAELCTLAAKKDFSAAAKVHFQLQPMCRACFIETNPIPVKTALHYMGKMELELRLPLIPMESANSEKLKKVMKESGLL